MRIGCVDNFPYCRLRCMVTHMVARVKTTDGSATNPVLLLGGPHDGLVIGDGIAGISVIAVDCFTGDSFDRASYRIARDRTTARYEGTHRVWSILDAAGAE